MLQTLQQPQKKKKKEKKKWLLKSEIVPEMLFFHLPEERGTSQTWFSGHSGNG